MSYYDLFDSRPRFIGNIPCDQHIDGTYICGDYKVYIYDNGKTDWLGRHQPEYIATVTDTQTGRKYYGQSTTRLNAGYNAGRKVRRD